MTSIANASYRALIAFAQRCDAVGIDPPERADIEHRKHAKEIAVAGYNGETEVARAVYSYAGYKRRLDCIAWRYFGMDNSIKRRKDSL